MDTYMASIAAQKLGITDARDMAELIKIAQSIHKIDVIRSNGFKNRRQEKYYEKRLDNLITSAMWIVNWPHFPKVTTLVINNGDPRVAPIYAITDHIKKFNEWLEQPWNAELKDAWHSDDTERHDYVKLRYKLSRCALDGVAIY